MQGVVVAALVAAILGALVAALVLARHRRSRRARPGTLDAALDRIEIDLLHGRHADVGEALEVQRPKVESVRGPVGAILRTRRLLLQAEFAADLEHHDAALATLAAAREALAGVPATEAGDALSVRADALAVLSRPPDEITDEELATGERALRREPHVRFPDVLLRLVWAAHWMAQIRQRRGDGPGAVRLFETSVAIAGRLGRSSPDDAHPSWDHEAIERFWVLGRRVGSAAATEIADLARISGDSARASEWYERAVAVLEGAVSGEGRLARAEALLARGLHAPVDELSGSAQRAAWLEECAAEAVAAGGEAGFALASRTEIELAMLRESMGETERHAGHLERAIAHASRAGEDGVPFDLRARFLLGLHHEEQGDASAARTTMLEVHERGHAHPDANLRRLAFLAAVRAHSSELEAAPARARVTLAALVALAPTLAPEARSWAAVIAAHARGRQEWREGRPDQARRTLAEGARMAQHLDEPDRSALRLRIESAIARVYAAEEKHAEAEKHVHDALDIASGMALREIGPAERADLRLARAQALQELGREREAIADLRLAFEFGRDAANARGRELAATAALMLGDLQPDEPDERRRLYETAATLARMAGTERARQVGEAAALRLRETAD